MKRLFVFCVCVISFFACRSFENKSVQEDARPKQNEKDFDSVGKGFYRGPDGRLYIKTIALIEPPEKYSDPFFAGVPDIDVATYENLGTDAWYSKDKNHIYIKYGTSDGDHIYIIKEADVSTFKVIGYTWAKDKNHVYNQERILDGLNPDSLVLLCPEITKYGEIFIGAMKDNDQVYYGDREMKGVDVASFSCTVLAYDSTKPYCQKNLEGDSMYLCRDKDWIYDINALSFNGELKKIKP